MAKALSSLHKGSGRWVVVAAWRRKKVARAGGGGSESQLNAAGKLLFVYYPCIPIPSPSPFPFRPTFRRVCVCPAGLLSPSILCNQPVFWHSGSKFPSPHSSYQLLSPFNLPSPISHFPSTIPHLQPPKTQSPAACCYCCSFPPHSLGSLNGPNQTQWLCQRQAVGAQALGT